MCKRPPWMTCARGSNTYISKRHCPCQRASDFHKVDCVSCSLCSGVSNKYGSAARHYCLAYRITYLTAILHLSWRNFTHELTQHWLSAGSRFKLSTHACVQLTSALSTQPRARLTNSCSLGAGYRDFPAVSCLVVWLISTLNSIGH